MKRIILLIFLVLIISGCSSIAGELPESVCINVNNLVVSNNNSQLYIGNGQIEVQLRGCNNDTV